ncbi:LLM class flavin-dependent oxidoreductase [Zunongwangia endophytica]|uniref:LLM class flavin-dependent oxidoreductase n=1 Tax=Zunongwangia endophytica TaxID=1808945 RepID=A0ABV8H9H3_9FLAO|nr:LLM class flavin-dependent oxidoreductase [Zunongwangia endophytica]MDN3595079.1 LLM class flavin-dependent oxidoreductase [Zunongwangia endophytica]
MNSKDIKYSILELAHVSKGNTYKQTLNNSLELAKLAEDAGYHRFWFAEHHNMEHVGSTATSILMGYIADNTSKIKVGSGGIMLPNHSPLVIAEQFGTLAQLYPGRIDLGLGRAPGTDPKTASAIRSDFMQAAQSFPNEIAKIERYFSSENKTSEVRAPIAESADVPLYILGSSTDSAHLAARKGLPYAFASHFATKHLQNALRIYREEFSASEVLEKPYCMAGVNVIIAETDEKADELFTTLIRMFLGILTGERDGLKPPTPMTSELKGVLNHPSVQQMLKYSFVGSKATVKKQVNEFLDETNVDELIAVSAMYDAEDRIKSVSTFAEIMQEINKESKKLEDQKVV